MNLPLVLDVVISLVFIYLVLSLLASELQELLATILQWRARHLRNSIMNLMAGGNAAKSDRRVLDLVDDIYNDPLIKDLNQEARGTMAQGFRALTRWLPGNRQGDFGANQSTGPSYIPAETFATALIDRLGVEHLTDRLIENRLEKFIQRIVGDVSLSRDGIVLNGVDNLPGIWEIAAQHHVDLGQDLYFRNLVADCQVVLRDYQSQGADLNTSVARLAEAMDRYLVTGDQQDGDRAYFLDRVRAFKLSLFGENNDRVFLSAGLQPTMQEVAGLFSKGSKTYKELQGRYDNLQGRADAIREHVREQARQLRDQASIQEQESLGLDPFIDQVLDTLTDEELRIYQDDRMYRKTVQVIDLLPDSVQSSMGTLARQAQLRARQTSDTVTEFRNEVAGWFDNSMSRASGVYKRNSKGIALAIGFAIAAFSNSDTFHILNRVASDESLRKVVTERAGQMRSMTENATSLQRPGQIAQELETLKNQTDQVLSDMTLPVTWNPSNLSRQLGCPYDPTPMANQDLPYAILSREQWYQLYRSCLNNPKAATDSPIWMQVLQMVNVKPFAFLRMLSGWFLSGIAIAMGAPFWFDLLGRLMNVRNTGSKPKSSDGSTKA
jgi:hypothetical protein